MPGFDNQINAGGGTTTYLNIRNEIAALKEEGAGFGEKSEESQIKLLNASLEVAVARLSLESIADIKTAVDD